MTEPRTFAPRALKKPLYTGDPNSRYTMCYKKLRRHEDRDIQYVFEVAPSAEEAEEGE